MLRWSVILLIGVGVGAFASAGEPADLVEIREYEVRADNRPVGRHTLKIHERNGRTLVTMNSSIAVNILLYHYSFMFDAREIWDGESLLSVEARTNANGKRSLLKLKRNDERALIQFQDQVTRTEPPEATNSFARMPPGMENHQAIRLLNLDDGTVAKTTWHAGENVKFRVDDRAVPCRKWVVEGDLQAELWFDDGGWLVRQKTNEQGHPTELRLISLAQEKTIP
ncbi:MAG: DUF6134 family protein [Planctomycetaceae bacterium]